MHILVVNDDGPPSQQSSPYVHPLISTLTAAGHIVSVCLPREQRSWIGKAHIIGQTVKPSYYRPSSDIFDGDGGVVSHRPSKEGDDWVLVDGTPASCVQIGLYHFFKERGPVDLVLSGPNYGRNTTACFALSSGTLGGALEAAVCKRKAIAVSYAFTTRNHDPVIIAGASRLTVKLVEHLMANWDADTDVYTVNVPLVENVENKKVLWTNMLQNYWSSESCFEAVDDEDADANEEEQWIREGEVTEKKEGEKETHRHTHKHFKWAPRFTDVYKSVEESEPGNDGWVVKEGYTSVTPLKANFMHALGGKKGEINLPRDETYIPSTKVTDDEPSEMAPRSEMVPPSEMAPSARQAVPTPAQLAQLAALAPQAPLARLAELSGSSTSTTPSTPGTAATPDTPATPATTTAPSTPEVQASNAAELLDNLSLAVPKPTTFYAVVDYGDTYNQPLIISALAAKLPAGSYTLLAPGTAPVSPDSPTLYIQQYEELPFEELMSNSKTMLANSYVIRKALIRKHYLATTAHNWATKYPESALAKHVKPTVSFEVDYAEFLDDALVEAWELHESWQRNNDKDETDKEWWILKPGMSDRGQGIRLFNSEEELTRIFEEWEEDMPDTDDETEAFDEDGQGIMTSDLRHFVAQPYIHPPLLLEGNPYKFHIRTYVLAVGALKVYVYKPMLALFAGTPYVDPSTEEGELDLTAHLTNTCLQSGKRDGTVQAFWDLPSTQPGLPSTWKETVFQQILSTTGELFEAAARGMGVHFQPTPNAFEVFGLDFVVDASGTSYLLEVNAFPDFKQTGREMDYIIKGMWEGVVEKAVVPFFVKGEERGDGDMVKCCDIDLGRR